MRISDWSSDVCSSDLGIDVAAVLRAREILAVANAGKEVEPVCAIAPAERALDVAAGQRRERAGSAQFDRPFLVAIAAGADRTSVVSGKRVSVRVDLGGRRFIEKQKTQRKK